MKWDLRNETGVGPPEGMKDEIKPDVGDDLMTPDRNLSILLVDDDMVDRIFVVRQLKQCGVATIIESAATVQ
ncbi:hypothetical protein KDL45_06395, partial [bacterium]|nr:hypothetical protein [bacterium]